MMPLRPILLAGMFTLCLIGTGCDFQSKTESSSAAAELTPEQKFLALLKKAESGDAEAQLEVSNAYWFGEATEIDDEKAFEWVKKSVAGNNPKAIFWLGQFHQFGRGTPKNFDIACQHFKMSSEQGDPRGEVSLGVCYMLGFAGKKDQAKAIEILTANAEKSPSPHVHRVLGIIYMSGLGVKANPELAIEYFVKAAESTLTDRPSLSSIAGAQFSLGEAYESGWGVPKSKEQALYWIMKAADNRSLEAQYVLGKKYSDGDGVVRDNRKALELFEKSAKRGHSNSQIMLGFLYWNGTGTERDRVLAYAWTNLAAVSGDATAKSNREIYEKQLDSNEKAEAQRLSATWKRGALLSRESESSSLPSGKSSSSKELSKTGTGTAFIVSKDGHAITNHHVINSCKEVRFGGRDEVVKVVTEDKINDLALIKLNGPITEFATVNSTPSSVRQGEDVVVFGFPLNSVISSGGNLTPGIVSALTGLGNNTNQIQITASIQAGSSGSPVLNKKSQVVGVVSSKISDTNLVRKTGQVGQNVNFAISGLTVKTFLDTHKVRYKTEGFFSFEKSTADIAEEAKKWTFVAECWN
jgi:TPR repeat protein